MSPRLIFAWTTPFHHHLYHGICDQTIDFLFIFFLCYFLAPRLAESNLHTVFPASTLPVLSSPFETLSNTLPSLYELEGEKAGVLFTTAGSSDVARCSLAKYTVQGQMKELGGPFKRIWCSSLIKAENMKTGHRRLGWILLSSVIEYLITERQDKLGYSMTIDFLASH